MRVSIGMVGALLTGVFLLTGCGAAGDRDQQVAAVAAKFLAATGHGDAATACSMLTPDTRDGLSTSDGTSCVEALPADRLSPAPMGGSQVWSDWAKVDTQAGSVFLTEFDDGWRVAAAGCVRSRAFTHVPQDDQDHARSPATVAAR